MSGPQPGQIVAARLGVGSGGAHVQKHVGGREEFLAAGDDFRPLSDEQLIRIAGRRARPALDANFHARLDE